MLLPTGLLPRLKKIKLKTSTLSKNQIGKVTDEITAIDTKLDKLMTAYLENALTLAEYQNAKNKLVTEKHALKDKLASLAASLDDSVRTCD